MIKIEDKIDRGESFELIEKFIEGMKVSLEIDSIAHSSGALPPDTMEFYEKMAKGDAVSAIEHIYDAVIRERIERMGATFSSEMRELAPDNTISKIALGLENDNTVLLWFEVEDWETEKNIYRLQRKINSAFTDQRISLQTLVSYKEDDCGIPYGFLPVEYKK